MDDGAGVRIWTVVSCFHEISLYNIIIAYKCRYLYTYYTDLQYKGSNILITVVFNAILFMYYSLDFKRTTHF